MADAKQIRYKFGENWASYSKIIEKDAIESAMNNLGFLVGSIKDKSFLDIGSGSEIHSLAAYKMGAKFIESVDYDKNSVSTTENVLKKRTNNNNWNVHFGDIVTMDGFTDETFDVVYSWGVLHHTGGMWKAIDNAASLVDDNGKFVIALYIKTYLCWFWKIEKYCFSKYVFIRPFIKYPFSLLLLTMKSIKEMKLPFTILNEYVEKRGMSFFHDVDDWLGGYPYESVVPDEVVSYIEAKGFKLILSKCKTPKIGLFGSGCGEWVFEKNK